MVGLTSICVLIIQQHSYASKHWLPAAQRWPEAIAAHWGKEHCWGSHAAQPKHEGGPHVEIEVSEGGPAGSPEGGHEGNQDKHHPADEVVLVVEVVVKEFRGCGDLASVEDKGGVLLAQIGADQAVQGPGDCRAKHSELGP